MDKKTIFASLFPLGLIGLQALGIWLFQAVGNMRGITDGGLSLPAQAINLVRSDLKLL